VIGDPAAINAPLFGYCLLEGFVMKGFSELTNRGRALRLRQMALVALERYDLDVRHVRLVTNEMNGIFRVDTIDGQKYILRVSDPSGCHSLEEIRSEMMWLAALRRDTDLGVPKPLTTRAGALVTTVEVPGMPEARHCIIFSWVPGPDLADRLSAENVYKLGELAALLHKHAKTFIPPEGFYVRKLDGVFPYADPDYTFVEPVVLFDDAHRDLFPPQRREVYQRVVERVQDALDRLYADKSELRVIHNDLHQWNVKIFRGKAYALDFEDLAWGYPVQDIATTLYYFQSYEQYGALREAFQQGYTTHNEWPEQYPGQIDTFIAGRGVMLANYVVYSDDPEDQQMAPGFVARVEERLRVFLDKS
jgi:Ser/Thr protein kinase RdoA (MazF antagonist)